MKKVLLIICMLFLVTACTNVKDLNFEYVINTVSTRASDANIYRTGYKYYLPRGMKVSDSTLFNEVLSTSKYMYYLYVDGVSYYEKVENLYTPNTTSYFSKSLSYDDKYGYVEIKTIENEKYLIEIMYNYAKIEVIVEEDDIYESLLNSINILKSIIYNDSIISNLLGDDVLNFVEEEFNIFDTTSNDSIYLQIDDSYESVEEELPDTDLIN